jgi:hypothetical protein
VKTQLQLINIIIIILYTQNASSAGTVMLLEKLDRLSTYKHTHVLEDISNLNPLSLSLSLSLSTSLSQLTHIPSLLTIYPVSCPLKSLK